MYGRCVDTSEETRCRVSRQARGLGLAVAALSAAVLVRGVRAEILGFRVCKNRISMKASWIAEVRMKEKVEKRKEWRDRTSI